MGLCTYLLSPYPYALLAGAGGSGVPKTSQRKRRGRGQDEEDEIEEVVVAPSQDRPLSSYGVQHQQEESCFQAQELQEDVIQRVL